MRKKCCKRGRVPPRSKKGNTRVEIPWETTNATAQKNGQIFVFNTSNSQIYTSISEVCGAENSRVSDQSSMSYGYSISQQYLKRENRCLLLLSKAFHTDHHIARPDSAPFRRFFPFHGRDNRRRTCGQWYKTHCQAVQVQKSTPT